MSLDPAWTFMFWNFDGDNTRALDWQTADESLYGTYEITFTATGIDFVQESVSYLLDIKRQCLDANMQIKIFTVPSLN